MEVTMTYLPKLLPTHSTKIKIEWYLEMYYPDPVTKERKIAAEIMGSQIFTNKSPAYISGYCQAKADQGFGVSIDDKAVKGLLTQ
jgi:hypothetical protein